jgi:hypothetical protein
MQYRSYRYNDYQLGSFLRSVLLLYLTLSIQLNDLRLSLFAVIEKDVKVDLLNISFN